MGWHKEKVQHVLGEVLQPRQQRREALGAWTRLMNGVVVKSASEPGTLVIAGEEEAPLGHVSSHPKLSINGAAWIPPASGNQKEPMVSHCGAHHGKWVYLHLTDPRSTFPTHGKGIWPPSSLGMGTWFVGAFSSGWLITLLQCRPYQYMGKGRITVSSFSF